VDSTRTRAKGYLFKGYWQALYYNNTNYTASNKQHDIAQDDTGRRGGGVWARESCATLHSVAGRTGCSV
jgi:hypothetical protein